MQKTHSLFHFDNSYRRLSEDFHKQVMPAPVEAPELKIWNKQLAEELGLPVSELENAHLEQWFSGNQPISGTFPLAQAYAGHQFGNFTMLGDGRAILLGEHITPAQKRFDIQLKGAGATPFSRGGDGRGSLSSMLREYLMSESIHGLGIPTTRSLAVVSTGEKVQRQIPLDGGIVTRVASSHIRVGTFEYARRFLGVDELQELLNYTLDRHYPSGRAAENPAKALLEFVMDQQINLIVHWMRVGFIHGVMNTDNFTISGETIDYGPCAFMNGYYRGTVFSSIDRQGRYAFGNQPAVGQWNLSCLAGALLPLLHENEKIAIDMAEQQLNAYSQKYQEKFDQMMARKFGFFESNKEVKEFSNVFLNFLEKERIDYTNAFLALESEDYKDLILLHSNWDMMQEKWNALLTKNGVSKDAARDRMQQNNPLSIPRNHLVEEALNQATMNDDYSLYKQLLKVMEDPYQRREIDARFTLPSQDGDAGYQTFCGT